MSTAPGPFEVERAKLGGLLVLKPRLFQDARGSFVKTFHSEAFAAAGAPFVPKEEFFSVSKAGVVRGLHFQAPPAAHNKLVYCLKGRVLDVVVDLRTNSPTFREVFSRELTGSRPELLFVPVGLAHGFACLADDSVMVYQTDVVYAPAQDAGILWNSIDFPWPVNDPILSDRDRGFPALKDFRSPF